MKHIKDGPYGAKCHAAMADGDSFVDAAMASDCNDCRTTVMVQPVAMSRPKHEGDPSVPTNITPEPVYTPEPMVGFPSLEELKKDRDGR